jgi:tetratricopeptide (TPR) repeat protein
MILRSAFKLYYFILALTASILFAPTTFAQDSKSIPEKKVKMKSSAKKSMPDEKLDMQSVGKYSRVDPGAMIHSALRISEKNPGKAIDQISDALSYCLNSGDRSNEAFAYRALGDINYGQGLYGQSVEMYQKAIAIYQATGEKYGEQESRNGLGLSFEQQKSYDKAVIAFRQSLELSEKSGTTDASVIVKNNLARVFEKQGKTDEALKEYKEVLAIEEKRNNKEGIFRTNNNIGNIYLELEKTEAAKKYYEKSAVKESELTDPKQVAEYYGNISKTLRKENKLDQEIDIRKKSIGLNSKLNDLDALSKDYLEIGKIYLEQKESAEAVPYLEKSVQLADKAGNLEEKGEAYLALSDAYKQQGNMVAALHNYEDYVTVKDSVIAAREKKLAASVNFTEELSFKQNKIDLLEKDMQLNWQTIELLKQEKSFSTLIIYALSGGLAIVFISSWLIYNSSRKRRIANQVLALKSLRSQMNPHFIFNALNSVNNFISKSDERSANKYLSDFSRLMRAVMENSQHEFISLAAEIEILKLYLTLEHSRFREKFEYELNVSDDLVTEQIQIPPMLIQPYIENAVWHGLRYRDDKGLLKVNIEKDSQGLLVIIEDNGIGRKRSAELKTSNQKDKISTGLKNTESRLKIINELYGARMKVNLQDLDPVTGTGTVVSIHIGEAKKGVE